jgi:Protein of unknown function (DUF2652)
VPDGEYRGPVSQSERTRRGYLLLADISGYTAFLAGTELEHANAIVHELTTLIRERLSPPMRFVKLEGDAVFCYADGASFEDGERLVELIESCYLAFSDRLLDMERGTTCRCAACASIGSLDLKFVAHYGTFLIGSEGDREDLAGPDVILVHRLLKNRVGYGGGPQAYAFLTEPCLQRLPRSFELPSHSESYESLGETTGGVHDLKPVIARMRETRRVYVGSEDADLEVSLASILIRPRSCGSTSSIPRSGCAGSRCKPRSRTSRTGREGSASGPRATAPTGSAARRCDWRPYTYFTNRFTPLGRGPLFFPNIETFEFIPTDTGTRVQHRSRLEDCGPLTRLRFRILRPAGRRLLSRSRKTLKRTLDEDAATER